MAIWLKLTQIRPPRIFVFIFLRIWYIIPKNKVVTAVERYPKEGRRALLLHGAPNTEALR